MILKIFSLFSNTNAFGNGRRVVEYNLSENYQLNENINAIRLILPLDIAYLLFMSMYLAMVIVLRMFQLKIPQSTFLACYNLITLVGLLFLFTIMMTFISIFSLCFLMQSFLCFSTENSCA